MSGLGGNGPPSEIPPAPTISLSYEEIADHDVIGQGGNADVYKTTVIRNGHSIPVAIKQPRLQGTLHAEIVDRFVAEAEVWESIDDHDHVVAVLGHGTEPLPWIAMEYMDGGSLESLLAGTDEDIPGEQAAWVGTCICEAVRHAHRHGIAHHDIKPANVLLREVKDGWDVPKVSDWGLARVLLDETGSIEGFSPQYAAPEQFDAETYGSPDDYTDIYQIGILLYELFTGRPPFEGPPATIMQSVLSEEPEPPSSVSAVPKRVDDVVLPALRKQKSERYESVLYLRDELDDLYRSVSTAEESTPTIESQYLTKFGTDTAPQPQMTAASGVSER